MSELDGYILGLDPGDKYTGWCLMSRGDYKPLYFNKSPNEEVLPLIQSIGVDITKSLSLIAVEMVASYGMPVGREVFETCVWIGRFIEQFKLAYPSVRYEYVYRKDEKMAICHSPKANDATIKQALVDRFADGASNHGKGTKDNRGFFYGFKADVWSAFAVCVTAQQRSLGCLI